MHNLFCLLKMSQLYKYHKHRLAKLMSIHQYTNCLMIKRYDEIGEIPYAYTSNLKLPMKKDMDRTTKVSLINAVLDSWVKWATNLQELYAQLMKEDTEYKSIWSKMYLQIDSELDVANKMHEKFYVVPKTKNIRMEMRAKLDAAKNAQE